ncbi:MAG: hypothetical protein LBS89_05910 [Zoogloeaceae bacterium]|jgi:ubiquinone/menaquinone biosynthesis C-methylase UbiE|nr:hypothetical protein [Zoogloeaceae bacterium]
MQDETSHDAMRDFYDNEYCRGAARLGALERFLDKSRALAEMRRVTKPGAVFLILASIAGFLTRRLDLYGGSHQVYHFCKAD